MTGEPFVLDLDSNPHPDLLAYGIELHAKALADDSDHWAHERYLVFLQTNAKATGRPIDEVAAWVARGAEKATA